MYKDRNVVAQLVRRAEKAGFKAIALTVDTPRLGRREADIKNRYDFFNLDIILLLDGNCCGRVVILNTAKNHSYMRLMWPQLQSL